MPDSRRLIPDESIEVSVVVRVVRNSRNPPVTVRSVVSTNMVARHPHESLADVAARMRENGASAVAITEDDRLVGIITERDVAGATADAVRPPITLGSNCLTTELVAVGPKDEAQAAAAEMTGRRIRHLPVVGRSGSRPFSLSG